MYAVIEFAGHQYKVKEGDKLEINSLKEKEGAKVSVDKVLMTFDAKGAAIKLGKPYTGDSVELKVLEHKKGDKVRVYKMLAKKRYRRNKGHRQTLTIVEVVKIGAAKPKAAAKPAEAKKAPASAKGSDLGAPRGKDKKKTEKKD